MFQCYFGIQIDLEVHSLHDVRNLLGVCDWIVYIGGVEQVPWLVS